MTLVCRWTMCIANQWLTSSGGEDEAVAAAPDHHQLHLQRGHRRRQVATVLSRNLLETNVMPGTYKFIDALMLVQEEEEEEVKKKKKFH